jgi:hypothetical protein
MSNYFIKHFYDQVKDTSWPDIKNYNDFLNLPNWIKHECNNIHSFTERLNELEDTNYWKKRQSHNYGYQYKNAVYIPVFKCASTYYIKLFKDKLGWKQVNLDSLDFNKIKAFGLLMDPMVRKVKGITQVLCMSFNYDYDAVLDLFKNPGFAQFVSSITMLDAHTIPYTVAFGELLNKIHWIPMEPFTDNEIKEQIVQYLKETGISVEIPNNERLNASPGKKEIIFSTIENIFLNNEPPSEVGLIFANDVKFYNTLLNKYANSDNYNTR